jgi:hypothetical protein
MTLIALNNTAIWHMGQGDYQQAEKVHRELLDIRLRKLGENHPDTVVSLRNVGSSLRGQERNADAVVYLKRAVNIGDVVRGRGHPGQLSARIELALALSQSGEVESSVALLRDSLPLTLTQTQRPTHRTVAYRATISEIFAIDKRFTEAMEEAVATRDAAQEVFGTDHEDARRAAALIRDAAEGLGDFAAARRANETLRGLPEYQTRWEIAPGTPDTAPPAAKPS